MFYWKGFDDGKSVYVLYVVCSVEETQKIDMTESIYVFRVSIRVQFSDIFSSELKH